MFTWFKSRSLERSPREAKHSPGLFPREALSPREAFFLVELQALERLSSSRSNFLLLACRDHYQPTSFSFIQHLKNKTTNKKEKETHKTKIMHEGKYNKKDIRLPPDERLFKVASLTVASPHFLASGDALETSSDSSFLPSWVASMSIFSPTR